MSRSKRAKGRSVSGHRAAGVTAAASSRSASTAGRWLPWLIVLAGLIAYGNSFSGPFIFDDQSTIVSEAPKAKGLAAIIHAPAESPLSGRPLVTATFYVNRMVFGPGVTSFHVTNLLVHLANGLLFFAIVRRTLGLPGLRERWAASADAIAAAAAIIWIVHPLNTEVVDYLTQRTESMMAACMLITIYASLRAAAAPNPAGWQAAAVFACALGFMCKETMVVTPIVVMLFDRVFLFESWRESFRSRRRLYAGLAATWLVFAAALWSWPRTPGAGFSSTDRSSWTYFLNQPEMLTRYLRLTIWPTGLVLNYGWSWPQPFTDVLPYFLFITTLFVITAIALVRAPRLGFLGAWCFLILGPTSSFVAISSEVGAERRMYLPLMALVLLAIFAAVRIWRRFGPASITPRTAAAIALAIVVVPLTVLTIIRNREYSSALGMAQTVVDRWPTGFAHHMLGFHLAAAGRHDEAIVHLRQAVAGFPPARYDLARELVETGKYEEAIDQLQAFLRDEPTLLPRLSRELTAKAHGLRAQQLADARNFSEAIPHYRAFLEVMPQDGNGWSGLGVALIASGQPADAAAAFQRAVEADPTNAGFHQNAARALLDRGSIPEASAHAERAVALDGANPGAHDVLARTLIARGRYADARREFERALQLDPTFAPAIAGLRALAGR
ncbi:MAG TPA: tetratricopeptide repeat protein [Vicinamibacterales bacterium]|nr:tetratricopeptide repeat protein [Vicinamibacterales bacterium]